MQPESNKVYVGDCVKIMRSWPDAFVQSCVTSPPYWGLRDYGVADQFGFEPTLEAYVVKMVEVFREVKRVLCDDGTLWLNLGDSYASAWPCSRRNVIGKGPATTEERRKRIPRGTGRWGGGNNGGPGLKEKDLIGIPWRVAFALQADGWYLRSDIIWAKPNPMPESVSDRPTKAHEYLFLMTKSKRYYYDAAAIKELAVYGEPNSPEFIKSPYGQGFARRVKIPTGWDTESTSHRQMKGRYKNLPAGQSNIREKRDKQRGHGRRHAGFNDRWDEMGREEQCSGMRNKRSVWTVATMSYSGAHFATFPTALIKPCILAGSRAGDVVLDPFMGAGTTALVALQYNRKFLGSELNPDYVVMAEQRIANEKAQGKFF